MTDSLLENLDKDDEDDGIGDEEAEDMEAFEESGMLDDQQVINLFFFHSFFINT